MNEINDKEKKNIKKINEINISPFRSPSDEDNDE